MQSKSERNGATAANDENATAEGEALVRRKPLAIVGIGASAGGLAALQAWFETVPHDLGVAYVVIDHLSPERRSELAAILGGRIEMPVTEVSRATELEPDHVYVIPPNRKLEISDNKVAAHPFQQPRGSRTPIDDFFRSLAATHGDGFAVLLSGGGSDGSVGLKSIKEHGGLILVQDPREAEFDSMPSNAIATGLADVVLPVRELAARFAELVQRRVSVALTLDQQDAEESEALSEILAFLRNRTGHDFSRYKQSTLQRRLARRLQVSGRSTLRDYQRYLRSNVEEVRALFDDLLISITNFFRDPEAFAALAESVVPKLFDELREEEGLRVWVPGCATGEEVYSIVILLLEEAARRNAQVTIKVFGSDLDEGVLATAREGRYPAAIIADVSEQRLRRFFLKDGHHYRVAKEVRDCALFATHSVLKDPPFSRLDLLSCRNLVIYLERELQKQVFGIFHYALRPRAYLFLGASENPHGTGLFRAVDKEHRIYQALEHKTERALELSSLLLAAPLAGATKTPLLPRQPRESAVAALHREALETLAPPTILVDEDYHVLNVSETAGRFLLHPGGQITSDVTRLVRLELQSFLRSALYRAFGKASASLSSPTPVRFNGVPKRVCVLVQPHPQNDCKERHALIVFLEGEAVQESQVPEAVVGHDEELVRHHSEELRSAHEQLQLTQETYDSTVEALRAANEELQSVNEEYRSTTEELETSKEELQSINEELQSVNAELSNKLEEISRAHNDLQNLMVATDVGTLFLDRELHIKRFTPRLGDIFSITSSDVGRSISDFTHRLDYADLTDDGRRVIEQLLPLEREVGSRDGHWYLIRFRPYRTIDNKIEGVVVTFVDISERKAAEEALRANRARLAHELEIMRRLHRMSMRVVAAEDLQSALQEILTAAIELQGADFGSIQLNRANADGTQIALHHGIEGPSLDALEQAIREPDSAFVSAQQKHARAVMEDVTKAAVSARYRRLAATAGYRAVQATPLVSNGGQTLGLLATHFRQPHDFSGPDRRLLDLLARHAADLVDRLQTEATLKDLNDRLEQRVQERTEQALETEGRFRALVEASAQMVWTTDASGEVVEDSRSWRTFTGQTPEQWLSQGWLEAVHPVDRPDAAGDWRRCVESEQAFDAEFRIYRASSDSYRWLHLRAVPLRGHEGEVRGWVGMGSDVTDSKRSAQQLRALAASLTLAEEKERRRIAQVLHDDLQQLLFGIQLRVKSLIASAKADNAASVVEDAEQATRWLGDAIEKTRGLSIDLSPPLLEEDEDFQSALKWLARRMQEVAGLQVDIHAARDVPIIKADTRVRLYQIVRELLFNVAKHAATERVWVKIQSSNDSLTVAVADGGRGFDVAAAMAKHEAGLGLVSIRDRLSFFGGHMDIDSAPGKGTVVNITVPLAHIVPSSDERAFARGRVQHPIAPLHEGTQDHVPAQVERQHEDALEADVARAGTLPVEQPEKQGHV